MPRMNPYLEDLFGLDRRVAIVTGASRGIGGAIAESLSLAKATVIGLGRSPAMENDVSTIDYRQCDIRNSSELQTLFESVYQEFGRIDILVNAAGITTPQHEQDTALELFQQTLATNLTAVFECSRRVIKYMTPNNTGSIINITSIGALQGFPGNPGYLAAKGGVTAMTRGLALDYGPKGIRVNNLVPGYIHTAMTDASYSDNERREARAARTMLGRWGEPDDLIGAALFLASDASRYVTGSDITVDGGWTAKGL